MTLHLNLTDYLDPTRWRWELYDDRGRFLADHDVQLDPTAREYQGFLELSDYLDYYQPIQTVEAQLAELGAWIGERVFGRLREALWEHRASPAAPVRVTVPPEADDLLQRPFELARFADGTPFLEAGLRLIYHPEDVPGPTGAKRTPQEALRVLAVFSLPVRANPLNLRRERYGLQRLVRRIAQTRGRAIELRVLQYGATRDLLEDALHEGAGWDLVHLSGHGQEGALLLEDGQGGSDVIRAEELGDLLAPTRARLKLLILDACYSGAGSHRAARAQVGLEEAPTRQEGAEGELVDETAPTVLPSLAQALSGRLDCAALAMRYPVGDDFATDLMLALYDKLLRHRQPLPAALHLALDEALETDVTRPPLSPLTPILVGPRATDLALAPPERPTRGFAPPTVRLRDVFPPEPPRFVGRLQPMLRASQALAPGSDRRGVLFYGMPGAGKTTCAKELSYRHAEGRFRGYVWHDCPEAGSDISNALFNLMQDIQTQLNAPDLGLTMALKEAPERFRAYTLPRLRALLQQYALLLVLDNLETLLTPADRWRDPLWGDLMDVLLGHHGLSRVVLTSRRCPVGLGDQVQRECIHALSFAESVLLARELDNLRPLFGKGDEEGRALLRRTLRVAQGHPKLLELADGLAADRDALAERVAAAADELAERSDVLDRFFAADGPGETQQSDADFVRALRGWTTRVARGLSPTAELLLAFLARLSPEDRQEKIVEMVWPHFLNRLGQEHPVAAVALEEPDQGLPAALRALEGAGLVDVERPELDPTQMAGLQEFLSQMAEQAGEELDPEELAPAELPGLLKGLTAGAATYTIHPGVAEAARAEAQPAVLDAADIEMGDFHRAMFWQAIEQEMEGQGGTVVTSARRAAPYLMRQARWREASTLLEQMLHRDISPATLAFALPLLRRIVDESGRIQTQGVLARALMMAGRADEAERMLRDLVDRAADQGEYRLASVNAGDLLNLLQSSGRLEEALDVAEEKAGYTGRAGLGPWTQLVDEGMRLQVLAAMGRYEEVLEEVARLRARMEGLPLADTSADGEAEETANPWNTREALLDTGRSAAMRSERWERALALNAEIVEFQRERGADALELARTHFNDHGPLLRLERYDEARELLLGCRAVFEDERDVLHLGKVYSALAELEHRTGDRAAAVRFEQVALGYKYRAGQPESCAISHHNLANYLARRGADAADVLAHRLAAAVIDLQMQGGGLSISLRNLAKSDLPPAPLAFAAVARRVEKIEGVRFRALFERLPSRVPDGDAAIAAVWELVAEEQRSRGAEVQRRREVLASMSPAIQSAIEQGDVEALQVALQQLPEQEAESVMQQLRDAGIIGVSSGPDMERVLREFGPLLQGIAAAVEDEGLRGELEPVLAQLEENGWRVREAAHRIWAGERDEAALTAGLDDQDSALVRRVLALLAG